MNNTYYLMHRNDIVTELLLDERSGQIRKIGANADVMRLPIAGRKSQDELRKWWARRAVPETQGYIRRILEQKGIHSPEMYLMKNMGLSLIDHYWIMPVDAEMQWEEVNLFENDFKDSIGEAIFHCSFDAGEYEQGRPDLRPFTTFSPSASTQGELMKKWVISEGKRILVKGNQGLSFQQSINEVIAGKIHEMQGRHHYVEYRLCDIRTGDNEQALGCACECFATVDRQFVPAYDVSTSEKKRNDMSEYEHFIKMCGKNGLDEDQVRDFLEYQILSDYLLTNTDRHFNNFGVLQDTESMQFLQMAPIFDSGNSMFYKNTALPLPKYFENMEVTSFAGTEPALLRYVENRNVLDIGKLPSDETIDDLLRQDHLYPLRGAWVLEGYKRKADMLDRWIHHAGSLADDGGEL